MIELTDLQEDILTLAVENPDMMNEEIAEILDCSEEWVGEVRRDFEHKVNESEVDKGLKTVSGTADNPPTPEDSQKASDYTMGIVIATGAWWFPILAAVSEGQIPQDAWVILAAGWIGVPALVYLDSKRRGSLGGKVIYTVAGVLLPMFAGLVYLSRRT